MNINNTTSDENRLLREENARLRAEVKDLQEHLNKFVALSAAVSSSSNNSNKRIKISNDDCFHENYDNINASNSTINTNSTNRNTTNTTTFSTMNTTTTLTTSTGSMRLSKIPCYNPSKEINWLLQFDGGSRGNPGIGGSGAVLYQTGIIIIIVLLLLSLILILILILIHQVSQ